MSDWPKEMSLKAAAMTPDMYEAMTEGRRFNFRFEMGSNVHTFTAMAQQADEPGIIRVFDIRPA